MSRPKRKRGTIRWVAQNRQCSRLWHDCGPAVCRMLGEGWIRGGNVETRRRFALRAARIAIVGTRREREEWERVDQEYRADYAREQALIYAEESAWRSGREGSGYDDYTMSGT